MLKNFISNYLQKDQSRSNKSNLIKLLTQDTKKAHEINSFVDFGDFKQRLYHYMNDIKEKPKCLICGGEVTWVDRLFMYRETCSSKCSGKLNLYRSNPKKVEHPEFTTLQEHYDYFCKNKLKITESSLSKYYPKILESAQSIDFVEDLNVKVYCFLKGISSVPICKNCNHNTCEFDTFSKGFHEYCSVKCSSNSEQKKSKIKETVRQKWGVDNVGEVTREKAMSTMVEKYGSHISQTKEYKENMKDIMTSKFDVEHYFQSDDFKEKSKSYFYETYGVEHNMQIPENIQKGLQTKKEKGLIFKWTKQQVKSFEEYRRQVTYLSEKSYETNIDKINPNRYERGHLTYHLDHIYPVILGFINGVSAEDISHWRNLQIIPHLENRSKGAKTELTLEEFQSKINNI
jgi:hypothetical protein